MSDEEKGFVLKDNPDEEKKTETAADASSESGFSGEEQLPEINFATFIFSLNSSALVHLGMVEEPGTDKKMKNLLLAKQTIDILGILAEKTKGNLTDDEDNLLKSILHDLRMMYVKEKS